jgi:hypothetical protein
MRHTTFKQFILLLAMMLPTAWCGANDNCTTMVIDYIRAYQLEWDCNTDETIACQTDLDSFVFKVKKTVNITSSIEEVEVESTDKITFRVTDSFEITGLFQVDSGGEFTVIRQDCPTQ